MPRLLSVRCTHEVDGHGGWRVHRVRCCLRFLCGINVIIKSTEACPVDL